MKQCDSLPNYQQGGFLMVKEYQKFSTAVLDGALDAYYRRLQSWNITPEKREKAMAAILEIQEELEKRNA
jgi:hypothetical protein